MKKGRFVIPVMTWKSFASKHVIGSLCMCIGIVVAACLLSFDVHDPSWLYFSTDHPESTNLLGAFGAQCAATLFYFFGIAAYLLIPFLCAFGYSLIRTLTFYEMSDIFGAAFFFIVLSTGLVAFHAISWASYLPAGGVVGRQLLLFLQPYGSPFLIYCTLVIFLVANCIIMLRVSFFDSVRWIFHVVRTFFVSWRVWFVPLVSLSYGSSRFLLKSMYRIIRSVVRFFHTVVYGHDIVKEDQSFFSFETGKTHNTMEKDLFWMDFLQKQGGNVVAVAASGDVVVDEAVYTHSDNHSDVSASEDEKKVSEKKWYQIPLIHSLFQKTKVSDQAKQFDEHKHMAKTLEEKLARFGVTGAVIAIKPGPVVTLFEYQPTIDAKLSKILALESDLALALEALSVRIIAPIPGTSRVGFEVANKKREAVFLRDMMHSKNVENAKGYLPIILGKDTSGNDIVVDLVDMPHLLIAGSTGSGKSVALNTLLISLLCKKTPDELKLVIIDPKRLEFAAYDGIAHLLFPLITQPHKAGPVLQWLVRLMEERYELMASKGVRGIFDYKKWCLQEHVEDELPFIVVIIDELADLMMVARKDVEDAIARLAQMARAAGIYLIVATQRPSVDVLTGVIKVNFPSRISFRVTSKIDSRTILDAMGAETLLGKGDMLFVDAQSSSIRRIHGPYVTDEEIQMVVNAIKKQREPEYRDLQEALSQQFDAHLSIDEPLMQEVLAFLKTVDEISISLLQRRFKIGYNRSARLIELLESQGKILPADGNKLRKVLH